MSVVQNNRGTTRARGVTGAGFMAGRSGNPGGRPKGLSRRVRELVGDDGHEIAKYMFPVLTDARQRTADRMEAGKWLADRGFGRAIQGLEVDVAHRPGIDLAVISTEDLDALIAIFEKYEPDAADVVRAGEIPIAIDPSRALACSTRQR